MEFNFKIEGSFKSSCDRCLEQISIPTFSDERLLVKIGDDIGEENEEVIYLDDNVQELNLATFIYEFINLSKPLKNVIDCESNDYEFCDERVLDKMSDLEIEEKQDPIWDQLKNIELG